MQRRERGEEEGENVSENCEGELVGVSAYWGGEEYVYGSGGAPESGSRARLAHLRHGDQSCL